MLSLGIYIEGHPATTDRNTHLLCYLCLMCNGMEMSSASTVIIIVTTAVVVLATQAGLDWVDEVGWGGWLGLGWFATPRRTLPTFRSRHRTLPDRRTLISDEPLDISRDVGFVRLRNKDLWRICYCGYRGIY